MSIVRDFRLGTKAETLRSQLKTTMNVWSSEEPSTPKRNPSYGGPYTTQSAETETPSHAKCTHRLHFTSGTLELETAWFISARRANTYGKLPNLTVVFAFFDFILTLISQTSSRCPWLKRTLIEQNFHAVELVQRPSTGAVTCNGKRFYVLDTVAFSIFKQPFVR